MRINPIWIALVAVILPCFSSNVNAQDSLDVTFRYYPNTNAVRSYVPGSFNNWGNNSNGRIPNADGSLLTVDNENGFSYKVVRLRVGGGSSTLQGRTGYAYKFHEQYNATGSQWEWFTDPLNPRSIPPNTDSFLEITHPLIFQMQPAANQVYIIDEPQIWANVAAKNDDPIDLQASRIVINGTDAGSFEGFFEADRSLLHVPSISDLGIQLTSGANRFKIVAVTQSGASRSDSTSFSFIAQPNVVLEQRPQGLEDGVTVHGDQPGSVSFSLYAPGKEFVHVIGDHSGWQVSDQFLMKKDAARPDSVHFWITLNDLQPGTYRFQYLIDGELRMPDLFSELILDPAFDQSIPSSVYPNRPLYPAGLTTHEVGVFEVGRTPYQWQVTNFQRPPQHELIIYELLLRDFVTTSTFDVLRDTLGYLENLGVNAIELMPVSNFDGNNSWGYNPNFHGALDKSYGTRESFKRFVDEAHSRGIAVILDVVYNHAQDKSPLIRLYGTNRANNPFIGPGHAYNVFFHLNHDHPYIKYWVDRMNRYWLETYNIDGFRFDLTKGFASNVNNQSLLDGYNAQRIANLKRMADKIWEYDRSAYIIYEHFAANSEEQELAHYRTDEPDINGIMFWGNLNTAYSQSTMGFTQNSNFAGGYFRNRGWTVPNLITYMESHDEQWLMFKNLRFGNSSGSYNVRDLNTALERQKMAGAFFFTIPGPKMIWQFGELGYGGGTNECLKPGAGNGDCLASDPGRTSDKPIRWQYFNQEPRRNLYRTWSSLIHLRREHEVFHSPDTQVNITASGNVKQIRLSHPTMDVTIIGNFGVTEFLANVTFSKTGTWYDYFSGNTKEVASLVEPMTLKPGQFNIFTSEPLPLPPQGITVDIDPVDSDIPKAFSLHQNYPNPFNPTTNIRYDLPQNVHVRVAVYDVLGRQVAVLVDSGMSAGTHTINFNATNLSSGTYLVRMEAGDRVFTQKMVLLK